jgi:hypothetical protein
MSHGMSSVKTIYAEIRFGLRRPGDAITQKPVWHRRGKFLIVGRFLRESQYCMALREADLREIAQSG